MSPLNFFRTELRQSCSFGGAGTTELFVMLTHYNTPQEVKDRFGVWLSDEIQQE
jgi:beta-glucosidase/6-phospho-beta-glucosidase/beta-galactosidase